MAINGSNSEKIVLSLGGSLIVPPAGIDRNFLKKFNEFIRQKLADNVNLQFFIVAGGGSTARSYGQAAQEVIGHEVTPEDIDWIGIHATRLNAHLIRTIFRDIAHPYVLKHYEIIRKVTEPIVIGAGWKPGWSTDFCATMVCEDYNAKTVVNMSNIEQVYNKDPRTNTDAKPITHLTWKEFRGMVGDAWIPGMNTPFDPIAAQKAEELGLSVVILKGSNLENLDAFLSGKEFIGTTIKG